VSGLSGLAVLALRPGQPLSILAGHGGHHLQPGPGSQGEQALLCQLAILGSEAYPAGLLDHAADQKVLRRHEREIASALRDIAALRAELAGSPQGGGPGPMTAAVLASHQRAC